MPGLAALARQLLGVWQLIVPIYRLFVILINDDAVTYLPDEIVRCFRAIPLYEHMPDAESFVLTPEEASRALQLQPELHETILSILDLHNLNL